MKLNKPNGSLHDVKLATMRGAYGKSQVENVAINKFVIEYAIVGNLYNWRYQHFYRFAGGRSRRKLEGIAKRMNDSGEAFCRVMLTRRPQRSLSATSY